LVILLPGQTENLSQIEKKLSTSDFSSVFQSDKKRIALALPSFRLEPATMVLAETLAQLGMPSAFDKPRGSADFSKIGPRLPNDYLFLSNVFHKAFISINESGTEAAAATATIMMRATALPPEPDLEVKIDRPFLFALLHKPSLAFLFLGRVLDPREKN
jgi:serpin B